MDGPDQKLRERELREREQVLSDGVAFLGCQRRTGIGYCVVILLAGFGVIVIATMADPRNVAGRSMCFVGGAGLVYFGLWLLWLWLSVSRCVGGYRDELERVREERWLVFGDGLRDVGERLRGAGAGAGEWWDGK